VAMVLAVGAAFACLTPAQNDTWWHLRSGREMWETRSFLTTERFSYTHFGAPLQNHWWLSQVLFYGLFALGGPPLLAGAAGACAWLSVLGSYRATRGPWGLRFALLLVLLVVTAPEWAVRPQVVSLAFLALCVLLVARGRSVWLPAVCLVWANAHAMVVFGVVMAGAVAAEAVLFSRAHQRRALAVLAACAAVPMISPLGWHYWPQVLGTVSTSRALGLQEYRTPELVGDLSYWVLAVGLLLGVGIQRAALRRIEPGYRALLIAAGVLMVAAFLAARNIAFFALVVVPAISVLIAAGSMDTRSRVRRAPWPAYALLALVVLAVSGLVGVRWRDGGAGLGWRPFSAGLIGAVRACPDPMFNGLEEGGPLMWFVPERRVFLDSRMEAYPFDLLQRSRDAELRGDYESLFADYGIRCAVVANESALGRRLAADPAMSQTYADVRHQVFVRD